MFNPRKITVHAFSGGRTLWAYKTKDALNALYAPNYFGAAADMLNDGDTILVMATDGARPLFVRSVGRSNVVVEPFK